MCSASNKTAGVLCVFLCAYQKYGEESKAITRTQTKYQQQKITIPITASDNNKNHRQQLETENTHIVPYI